MHLLPLEPPPTRLSAARPVPGRPPSLPSAPPAKGRRGLLPLFATVLFASICVSCAEQAAFDSGRYVRDQVAQLADPELAESLALPFELQGEAAAVVAQKLKPAGDTRARVGRILDYVFRNL
ncbi:MAG: hypothetical protein MI919_21050, partial [Holophagales bacterium]|nr:hypothetical protein [Holophagales bacterium]